jgi:hypothetical protein
MVALVAAVVVLPGALCVQSPNAPPMTCDPEPVESPCIACAKAACCDEIARCAQDAVCRRLIRCRARGASLATCARASTRAASERASALLVCWGSARCAAACAEIMGGQTDEEIDP